MKKCTLHAAVWMLVGMALMGLIVWFTMPSLMLIKHQSNQSCDDTITTLSESLKMKQGWKLLKVNDYQKATAAFSPMESASSLTICNPRYASNILADDANRGVTAFMPLAIGVYEDKAGQVYVSQLNVGLMGMMFGGTIAEVMGLAGADISEVIESVKTK